MSNNALSMVRNQFRTRGYSVGEIEADESGNAAFQIESDRDGKAIGVQVTFIASNANPQGDTWNPSNIRWGTNKTTYEGRPEHQAAAQLADYILASIAEDNQ
jgi:hypothetical protein